MTQSNTDMTQSNTIESNKPQNAKQLTLLEQLRDVSGAGPYYHQPPVSGV
jgi:hypothetical protein